MLVKKELISVPVLPMPVVKGQNSKRYIPAAQIVELPKSGRILAVDYYTKDSLFCRFFCDGQNSIVWDVGHEKWRSGCPVPGSGYYAADLADVDDTDAVCKRFFNCKEKWPSGIELVNRFVCEKGAEKRSRAAQTQNNLMKAHMAMFPAYPDNIQEYCSENVFTRNYIFFGKKEAKGIRKARCSRCGTSFTIDKFVVSGSETTCPKCYARAVYRANWIKSDVEDRADICIASEVGGQLLLRWVHVHRYYCYPEFQQSYVLDDFAYSLYLLVNGNPKIYSYKLFQAPYAWGPDWHRLQINSTIDSSAYLYTDNLDKVFGKNFYNVNLKAGLEGKHIRFQFVHLLDELKHNPRAEFLFKLGLPLLASNASSFQGDPDGKGVFQQQLGISKQYLPMLQSMNVTISELRVIKSAKQWVTPELLQMYRNALPGKNSGDYDALDSVIKVVGLSKALRYIDKQRILHPKEAPGKLTVEYRDYLRMSRDLHVDLSHKSVLFPADIVDAHRTLVGRYNAVKKEIEMKEAEQLNQEFHERVTQIYASLGLTGFQKGDFCIVLPQKRTDLIAEGQSLNHCVGMDRYYHNHMKGRQMIFFIRAASKPDKPYFTMELDVLTGRILQLYGFGDCSAPKDVRKFAEDFAMLVRNKGAKKTA